jgi:trans-L-3-hydroxyproline dehydratase
VTKINDAARKQVEIMHPGLPEAGYLFGTLLTDDAPPPVDTYHLCVFADRQIDRSPTGGGVISRMARDYARGLVQLGTSRRFFGPTPAPFTGSIVRKTDDDAHAVVVRVEGSAFFTGRGTVIMDEEDPLTHGFVLPKNYGALQQT